MPCIMKDAASLPGFLVVTGGRWKADVGSQVVGDEQEHLKRVRYLGAEMREKAFDALVLQPTTDVLEYYGALDFDIVTLASENNILSVLPCAYYRLLNQFNLSSLFDGVQKEDGTITHLSGLDLRRCVVAREKLLTTQFQPGYTFGWARQWVFDDCDDVSRCRALREDIQRMHLDGAHIRVLARSSHFLSHTRCFPCTRHITESIDRGRKKTWDKLPKFFDLPPWGELKNNI
ncbi:hypothetical protein B0H14DRAFT_3760210 [Mycena olivaceomarginata]|nr:hypothetical protein B0H14DRAFT_3760210 [Mycena olivaceomarginata]